MDKLTIYAGAEAFERIRNSGLQPDDISTVFGASGAAKWLAIAGLDRRIFTEFLSHSNKPVHLHGTSIGAFKLCCAAQNQPGEAIDRLTTAYIDQTYNGHFHVDNVEKQIHLILEKVFNKKAVDEILTHPKYRFSCAVSECKGFLAKSTFYRQHLAMFKALVLSSTGGRSKIASMMNRVIFADPRITQKFVGRDAYLTSVAELDAGNFQKAILASGSIPLVMNGVTRIKHTDTSGIFRDGGLIDYHPVPENILGDTDGLILYPHFYPWLIEGWFDKFFSSRKVAAQRLRNVILVAPSSEYVRSLPGGRIPDRHDFYRFKNDEAQRQRRWREAVDRSHELGEQWMRWVNSGELASKVKLMVD